MLMLILSWNWFHKPFVPFTSVPVLLIWFPKILTRFLFHLSFCTVIIVFVISAEQYIIPTTLWVRLLSIFTHFYRLLCGSINHPFLFSENRAQVCYSLVHEKCIFKWFVGQSTTSFASFYEALRPRLQRSPFIFTIYHRNSTKSPIHFSRSTRTRYIRIHYPLVDNDDGYRQTSGGRVWCCTAECITVNKFIGTTERSTFE